MRQLVCILLVASAITGCNRSADEPYLLPGAAVGPSAESDEMERLRRMQEVRYQTITFAGGDPVSKEYSDATVEGVVAGVLVPYCKMQFGDLALPYPPCDPSGGVCDAQVCAALTNLCVATQLLEIASVGTQLVISNPISLTEYTFPPQSSATNAGLTKTAFRRVTDAMEHASFALRDDSFCSDAELIAPGPVIADSYATLMAGVLSEAYPMLREAIEAATQHVLAVADFQYHPDTRERQRRRFTATELSRAEAAHLLIGGDPGLINADTICNEPEARGSVAEAVDLFRHAAVAPDDILDSNGVSLDALIGVNGQSSPGGSLMDRFADVGSVGAGTDPFTLFDLSPEDFAAARTHLQEEILALGRSRTAILGTPPIGLLPKFAGVATKPTVPEAAFYAAIASFVEGDGVRRPDGNGIATDTTPPNEPYAFVNQNLLDSIDLSHAVVASILGSGRSTAVQELFAPQLALLADSIRAEHLGRWQLCNWDSAGAGVGGRVFGFSPTSGLKVMIGEDGLNCAVRGSIDGAPCDIEDPDLTAFSLDAATSFNMVGFETTPASRVATSAERTLGDLEGKRLYLVAPRSSAGTPVAGRYEALAAGFVPLGSGLCNVIPIVPDTFNRAGEFLTPAPEWCARQQLQCDGTTFDERLPLEDELSEDHDGVESSWKHYLTLAKQAASEADLLGRELLEVGTASLQAEIAASDSEFQRSVQAISALERLQQSCGTNVDPTVLLEALGSPGENKTDLSNVVITPEGCSEGDSGCTCPTNACPDRSECFGGKCLARLEFLIAGLSPEDPDMAKLRVCMGLDDEPVPYVALGAEPLCFWEYDGLICGVPDGTTAASECPVVATSAAGSGFTCPPMSPPPGASTVLTTTRNLGFTANSVATGGAPPPNPQIGSEFCADFRTWRDADVSTRERMRESQFLSSTNFDPDRLEHTVGNLVWKDKPYSHFSIVHNGAERFTSGDLGLGVEPTPWPCVETCASSSMFCESLDCETSAGRADPLRERIRNAVHVAKLLIYKPEGSIEFGGGEAEVNPKLTGTPYFIEGTGERITVYEENDGSGIQAAFASSIDFPAWQTQSASHQVALFWPIAVELPPPSVFFNTHPLLRLPVFANFASTQDQADPGLLELYSRGEAAASDPALSYEVRTPLHPLHLFFGTPTRSATVETVLDAVELLCTLAYVPTQTTGEPPPGLEECGAVPEVTSAEQLPLIRDYIVCIGNQIEESATHTILQDVPTVVVDGLTAQGADGRVRQLGGDFSAAIAEVRSQLFAFKDRIAGVAHEVRQMGYDIDDLNNALAKTRIAKEIESIQFQSNVANHVASCAEALAGSGSSDPTAAASNAAAGVVRCLNATLQIAFEAELLSLREQGIELDEDDAIIAFKQTFVDRARALESLDSDFGVAREQIAASLSQIENLQHGAYRSLAESLFIQSYQADAQYKLEALSRRRFNALRLQHEEARQYAVRTAFLAKRAIENRIGERLSDLTDPLPLVEAPATWESSLCATSGIDFDALIAEAEEDEEQAFGLADAFVGAYVRRLEGVVESYRLVNGFHEGTDTVVLSLRDDVYNVRAPCQVPSRNLLVGDLSTVAGGDTPGWTPTGCAEAAPGEPKDGCVGVIQQSDVAFEDSARYPQGNGAFRVTFGPPPMPGSNERAECDDCGLTENTRLRQLVALPLGRYQLSWYARQVAPPDTGPPYPDGVASVAAFFDDGAAVSLETGPTEVGTEGWTRHSAAFSIDIGATIEVAVIPEVVGGSALPQQIDLAGLMLTVAERDSQGDTVPPGLFESSTAEGTRTRDACQDTDGTEFRRTRWSPTSQCLRLCDNGFSGQCEGSVGETYCYRETSFHLSQRDIELGNVLNFSGFARGNFNYRIENLAVNFVGTDLRNCEDSVATQTCYSAGFVPYTLLHEGPYFVRNFDGDDFEVNLFSGRIEHARGLATERYLTNPLGSSDTSLIEGYLREEFQGRPLDGRFIVRVWEEEGVDFDAIEDVQILLNYRYWTRFN